MLYLPAHDFTRLSSPKLVSFVKTPSVIRNYLLNMAPIIETIKALPLIMDLIGYPLWFVNIKGFP